MAKRIKAAVLHPMLKALEGVVVGLTEQRPPQNTLPINQYGIVTIDEGDCLIVVSIPNNQMVYVKWFSNDLRTPTPVLPKLPTVMGNWNAEICRLSFLVNHPERVARLLQCLVEHNAGRYSLEEICAVVDSLSSRSSMTDLEDDDETQELERHMNKKEFKRLLNLINLSQPPFDAARDSVRFRSPSPSIGFLNFPGDDYLNYIPPMGQLWKSLPSQLMHGQISKHFTPQIRQEMRTINKNTAESVRMTKKRLPFSMVTEQQVPWLIRILSNTDIIALDLVDPDDGSEEQEWDIQRNAWTILMQPEIMSAFCKVKVLVLDGAVAGDKKFYKFLSTLLTQPKCSLQTMQLPNTKEIWSTLYDVLDDDDKVHSYDQLLINAIATNRSVKQFIISGPYKNGPGSIIKTWLDGMAQRQDIMFLEINTTFSEFFEPELKDLRTPMEAVIAVLSSNAASLQKIVLTLGRTKDHLMIDFQEAFLQNPSNDGKVFEVTFVDDDVYGTDDDDEDDDDEQDDEDDEGNDEMDN